MNSSSPTPASPPPVRPKKRKWLKALKILLITICVFLLLIILGIGGAVLVLTPERLTPIVNNIVSKQLVDADFRTSRVELTFWSTFPRLKAEVDSLTIVSRSLRNLDSETRSRLVQGADSLLKVGHFSGSVDVVSLLAGKIHLYDVELHRPAVNIVVVDSLRNNYTVFKTTEKAEPDTAKLSLPDISITRFEIIGGFPVTYTSLPDSLSVRAKIAAGNLGGTSSPIYTLKMEGDGAGRFGTFSLPATQFGLNGSLHWEAASPGALQLRDMTVSADKVALQFDAATQLLDTLAVNEFRLLGDNIAVADVLRLIPSELRGELAAVSTDLRATLSAELLAPYIPSSGRIPPVQVKMQMPRGSLTYKKLHLTGLEADMEGVVDPDRPDRSRIVINKFLAMGKAIDFTLTGTVEHPVTDPVINGTFRGNVDFSRFPHELTDRLPFTLSGTLSGDASFKFRTSHLTPKNFHRVRIDGELSLKNFRAHAKDGSADLFVNNSVLKLGTSSSVKVNGLTVDSLLTASLTVDTMSAGIPGLILTGANLKMSVGTRNIASSVDTTRINPIGATVSARNLTLRSDSDSVRVSLKGAMIHATLTRYKNQARSPLLKMNMAMDRLRMADRFNRFSLRDAEGALTLHPKTRPPMSPRMQARFDSIAALHPGLSSDSIRTLAFKSIRGSRRGWDIDRSSDERIDWNLDGSLKSWLRVWQANGHIKACRARLFTPYFPVRNTLSNVNLGFSTDSITIRDTRYRMGHSDFLINGTVSNISRSLTSRRGSPMKIDLDITSDSLDINDITRALMMGAAFTDRLKNGTAHLSNTESDDALDAAIATQVGDTARAAVLIPTNVLADISVKAKNMKYGDILFQRFTGHLLVKDGALQLERLGAFTPMGSFGMTALYSAPNARDIRFAGGMVIRRLDLHQFLTMIPEIDTILPMLKSMEGIITAECALTSSLDSLMNLRFNTLEMALKLSGDSLVLLDSETFRKLSKWMMFKNKKRNMIDSMSVEMRIADSRLEIYPFLVSLDRYRFGISGGNDAGLNLDYHIAVLKSPIPFKFGVNIKGTPEHMKIRLGRARFNEKKVTSSRQLTDTARINLIREIRNMFKFGVRSGRNNIRLTLAEPKPTAAEFEAGDTISPSDSLFFIRQGVIEPPPGWIDPDSVAARKDSADKHKKKKKKSRN